MSRITSTSNSLITQGQHTASLSKKTSPGHQPMVSLVLSSCPFIANIFLTFCVFVCVCVCVCVIGVDISGICVSLFRRGRMNNSVWTHTNMCARHQWHGEEVSAAVSLYDSSELTAGWLTDVTSSISCFSKCPKQTSVYVKAKKPSSGCAHDSCHRSASHRSTDTGSRAAESCSTLWNKALEKSERQLIVHMV